MQLKDTNTDNPSAPRQRLSGMAQGIIAAMAISLLSACASNVDQVSVSDDELSSAMQAFHQHARRINEILESEITQPDELISILNKMDELSVDLGAGSQVDDRLLDENIHQLQANFDMARSWLMQEPPNYYRVKQMRSNCTHCHKQPLQ